MVQGDSYPIKVQIKKGTTIITDQNCAGVRIKLGSVLKESANGEITYNSVEQVWEYPMSQEDSLSLCENAPMEIQIKIGQNIYTSSTKYVRIERGVIKEVWGE